MDQICLNIQKKELGFERTSADVKFQEESQTLSEGWKLYQLGISVRTLPNLGQLAFKLVVY